MHRKESFLPLVTSPRRRRNLTTTHSSLQVRISSGVVSKICFVTTLSFTSCPPHLPPILDLQKDLALFSSLSDTSSLFVGKSNHHDLLVSTDTTTEKNQTDFTIGNGRNYYIWLLLYLGLCFLFFSSPSSLLGRRRRCCRRRFHLDAFASNSFEKVCKKSKEHCESISRCTAHLQ